MKLINKIRDFNDDAIKELTAATVKKDVYRFATSNAYSAFQLARLLKKTSILFEGFFQPVFLKWGLKAKIKVFTVSTMVNHDNMVQLATFKKAYYDPVIAPADDNQLLVVQSGAMDARDIDFSSDCNVVFYSNMKKNGVVNVRGLQVLGFSADESIFNSSLTISKQLRIGSQPLVAKQPVFEQRSLDGLQKALFTKGGFDASYLNLVLEHKSKLKDQSSAAIPLLDSFPGLMGQVNFMYFGMQSMSRKEAKNIMLLKDKSRLMRISKGAGITFEHAQRVLDILLKFQEGDFGSMLKQLIAVHRQFKPMQDLLNGLFKAK